MQNAMKLTFSSLSENEAFARNVVATFILNLNPTLSEINDIVAAEQFGLHAVHVKDNYVYLINNDGTDSSFKGFHNNVNQGVTAPYLVCTTHSKATWDAYVAQHGPTVTPPDVPAITGPVTVSP